MTVNEEECQRLGGRLEGEVCVVDNLSSSDNNLKESERGVANAIVWGVSTVRENRERYRMIQEEMRKTERQIAKDREMIKRLESFIQMYGDGERKSSVDLLNMRIRWAGSDLERFDREKAFLEKSHKELLDVLHKCGVFLKHESLV